MKTHSESKNSAVIDNVATTVECCYEGSPVPFSQVLEYAQCSPDDITRAVKAGRVKVVAEVNGVYFDQLCDVIESRTGLYTSI